ncbi:sensor histidine kinase [Phenylobacterium montanum]|uniref:histidine kinase n=1 Tax=Phenylobacterium montanum TaxID=2823693 RepID=A0A975FZJ2_9CAUL|nr:HAMP domain-containing sensor histidine kinase [Caulobacter sp. S6]QUD88024.1 HAMP domain-containing histidine kinase [Caulobacter sp. S6]
MTQAVVVVVAFAIAGYLAHVSIGRLNEQAARDRVRGEAASLEDEFALRGGAHLPHTVAKRSRQRRGFEYRLVGHDGQLKAGVLPAASGDYGWASLRAPVGGASERFLVFSERLPDGSVLSTGEALAPGDAQMAAVNWTLLACGTLGVIFCFGVSYLFTRRDWLRIAAVAQAAHAVSAGQLDVRVPLQPGAPRDDMDEMAQTFNTMLDRIGDLLRQVRQVSTDIAHDLRTPLTRLRQKIERLALEARADPALLAAVRGLDGDVGEILRTFDAMLQLSEIESTGLDDRARPVAINDLAEIAGRVADAFRPDIEESGRTLAVRTEPVLVRGDGRLLAQAMANLLENALRHTPQGASIQVRVAAGDGRAVLVVQDDGPGIPAAEAAAVLKPFVRLEPSRRMPGSGLGLSIVAAVAARHRAQLSLEDATPGLRVRLAFAAEGGASSAPGSRAVQSRAAVAA